MANLYQAYHNGCTIIRSTPKRAALGFFNKYPNKSRCNVTEEVTNSTYVATRFGIIAQGQQPQSWNCVTKEQAHTLPDVARNAQKIDSLISL